MALGIDHSKKVIGDLKVIAIDAVYMAKHLSIFAALKKLPEVFDQVKDIIGEAPQSLPELKDIDSTEAGQLTSACYDLVKGIIDAVVAA